MFQRNHYEKEQKKSRSSMHREDKQTRMLVSGSMIDERWGEKKRNKHGKLGVANYISIARVSSKFNVSPPDFSYCRKVLGSQDLWCSHPLDHPSCVQSKKKCDNYGRKKRNVLYFAQRYKDNFFFIFHKPGRELGLH